MITNKTDFNFELPGVEPLILQIADGVFVPNTTTQLLIQAIQTQLTSSVTMLDLGCGSGAVGIALFRAGLLKGVLSASDLSDSGIICCQENVRRYDCPADVRLGSLFEPWGEMTFDLIVDDISGVAQDVAMASPWFQGVPCNTGLDGTDLIIDIIQRTPSHLSDNGHFFFPVLSLSNVDKLLSIAKKTFKTVNRVVQKQWPIPEELKSQLPMLREMRAAGLISFEEKFGMVLCYTEIYHAQYPS
jgi:hypothetical protein